MSHRKRGRKSGVRFTLDSSRNKPCSVRIALAFPFAALWAVVAALVSCDQKRTNENEMSYLAITDAKFDRAVSLRDAYRLIERFVSDYLERGDTLVSDFLHAYAGEWINGQTTDPAASYDLLAAAEKVLVPDSSGTGDR